MLAPKNLKVGDTFKDEYGVTYKIKEVIPFIGYNAEITDEVVKNEKVTDVIEEKAYIPALENSYEDMSIKELQALCKDKGLSIRGTKAEVIARLRSV